MKLKTCGYGVSADYEVLEEFQKYVVPDLLSRPQDGRTQYIQKFRQASTEQLYAAEGPESFGWIGKTVSEQSTLIAHESDAELLDTGVESLSLLKEDPRLETISSGIREAISANPKLTIL